jgi:hypothetical protein
VARYWIGVDGAQARRNEKLDLGTAMEDQSAAGPEAGEVRSSTLTLARIRIIGYHRGKNPIYLWPRVKFVHGEHRILTCIADGDVVFIHSAMRGSSDDADEKLYEQGHLRAQVSSEARFKWARREKIGTHLTTRS